VIPKDFLKPKKKGYFNKRGGKLRRKGEEEVADASKRHQIKLHTSCDVPAPLNHLRTTGVDGARSIFAPTVVSSPDQKHFPKNAPGTIVT
jgi:hypothetical protein